MKFALILVALVGVANASLGDDIRDLLAIIPGDEIREITADYAANDAQFQQVVAYLKSESFQAIVAAVSTSEAWIEFTEYLDESGVNIYSVIVKFYELLGFGSAASARRFSRHQRSFHGWLEEVLALIPTAELVQLAQEKLQTSTEFQEFVERISSEEFQEIVEAVAAVPEYQELLQKGREHGAPVDVWLELIYNIFGWTQA